MRLKAKSSVVGLLAPPSILNELDLPMPVTAPLGAAPSSALLSAAGSGSGALQQRGSVLASSARQQQASSMARPASTQQQGAAPAAAAQPEAAPVGASGRPQRKRKAAFADDMVPTDLALRRGTWVHTTLPRGNSMPSNLAALPSANGGTQLAGLPLPASLLAMPNLQQQLLRAQGAGAQRVGGAAPQGARPYRLVAPGGAARDAASDDGSSANEPPPPAVPVVKEASPRDIMHLARQMEEEDRRKALAASEARAALRALQAGQAAGARGLPPKPPAGRGAAGRGRSVGARSRRPTPDTPAEGLRPSTWHPGFEGHAGVTYVSVAQAAAAPPLPAVAAGQPPRFAHAGIAGQQPKATYAKDPLRSSVQFLRDAARTAGGTPPTASGAAADEQRQHRERLARAHYARDGRSLVKEPPEATRRSLRMRARSAPDLYAQLAAEQQAEQQRAQQQRAQQQQQRAKPRRPEEDTDVYLGAKHQARLPEVRPRPAAPPREEARWTSGLVCAAGDAAPPRYDGKQTAAMPSASAEERAAWVADAHASLRRALGDERAAAMGLLAMGATARAGLLSAAEEAALEAGMRDKGRAFRAIQAELLPRASVFDLQDYYFNVWKLRATPRSRAWYEEKAAAEARQVAELERAEAEEKAAEDEQRQRLERRYKRRMLREALQWLKGAARAPAEAPNRPVLIQRAQRAAVLVHGLNAPGKSEGS